MTICMAPLEWMRKKRMLDACRWATKHSSQKTPSSYGEMYLKNNMKTFVSVLIPWKKGTNRNHFSIWLWTPYFWPRLRHTLKIKEETWPKVMILKLVAKTYRILNFCHREINLFQLCMHDYKKKSFWCNEANVFHFQNNNSRHKNITLDFPLVVLVCILNRG